MIEIERTITIKVTHYLDIQEDKKQTEILNNIIESIVEQELVGTTTLYEEHHEINTKNTWQRVRN